MDAIGSPDKLLGSEMEVILLNSAPAPAYLSQSTDHEQPEQSAHSPIDFQSDVQPVSESINAASTPHHLSCELPSSMQTPSQLPAPKSSSHSHSSISSSSATIATSAPAPTYLQASTDTVAKSSIAMPRFSAGTSRPTSIQLTHPHNFEECNSRLVVIGEINMLQIVLRKTYGFLNDLDTHRPKLLAKLKASSSIFASARSQSTDQLSRGETIALSGDFAAEDEEDDLLEALNSGQLPQDVQESISLVQFLNLKKLKERLMKNFNVLIDHSYLQPFCDLIKKGNSGHIIGLALGSLLKFLNYGLIDYTEANGSAQLISETILEVRFNVTNSSNDEVVLMRILLLLREIVTRGFTVIKNETIIAMLKTCFKFLFEMQFSELLRKTAEHALVDMIRTIFMQLHEFHDKPIQPTNARRHRKIEQKSAGLGDSGQSSESSQLEASVSQAMGSAPTSLSTITPSSSDFVNKQGVKFADISNHAVQQIDLHRAHSYYYDIQCIYEILEYICSLLIPMQKQESSKLADLKNADQKNHVGLNLLIVVFETAVLSIGEKKCLMQIVRNQLCWNLLLLVHPDRPISTFLHALRLNTLIFSNLRTQLKYQFEKLLVRIIEIVCSNQISPEYCEVALDCLFSLQLQIPFFAQELYMNYDCDLYSANICEDLIRFCSKICCVHSHQLVAANQSGSEPNSFNSIQQIALNSLLVQLKSLQKAELVTKYSFKCYIDKSTYQPEQDDDTDAEADDTCAKSNTSDLFNSFSFPLNLDELTSLKLKKKLLAEATEQFNAKPTKGISFLQEHHLVNSEDDIVNFLRENLKLDKKSIGDFLSNRRNESILTKFAESFDFVDMRLDEALRLYLEAFRLPGEAPLISNILEKFSSHWYLANNKPFGHEDSVFTLAYAMLMLNTDQHNSNVRQSMTCDDFVKNLRGANSGQDFDQDMLRSIYITIREDKFITPAEMTGLVKDQYLWKCMLKRSQTLHGLYWYAAEEAATPLTPVNISQHSYQPAGDSNLTLEQQQYAVESKNSDSLVKAASTALLDPNRRVKINFLNKPIFDLLWRPTLESLSFLFEKISINQRTGLIKKILNHGFTSSAFLCSHYGHLDDLIAGLCKFTVNSAGGPQNALVNTKSQDAAMCLFNIAKEYSNQIRASWSNLVEMLLNWYRARFLEEIFELEDFALGDKLIKMRRKPCNRVSQKHQVESGSFFTSFYQFIAGSDPKAESGRLENGSNDGPFSGVQDASDPDKKSRSSYLVSIYSQPLYIIRDSKFFHLESLISLVSSLINACINDDEEDDIEAFKLELIIQIILLNRDRVSTFWPQASDYLQRVLHISQGSELLAERAVSALFRLAIRFTPRQDGLSEQIFSLLPCLLKMNPRLIQKQCAAHGLNSFISHCHNYIVKKQDWALLNELLLFIGICYRDSQLSSVGSNYGEVSRVQSDGESSQISQNQVVLANRGYTSDSEIETLCNRFPTSTYITLPYELLSGRSIGIGRNSAYRIRDANAYEKCIDSITVLAEKVIPRFVESAEHSAEVRQIINICVQTIRKYIEASIQLETSGSSYHLHRSTSHTGDSRRRTGPPGRKFGTVGSAFDLHTMNDSDSDQDWEEYTDRSEERIAQDKAIQKAQVASITESFALRLLQLVHDLQLCIGSHKKADDESDKMIASISQLWTELWCPLLQANALLCCDARKMVRTSAVANLQRALLNRDLQQLPPAQWENCFNCVLFPLLSRLLLPINLADSLGMDETRVRVTNLLSKLFLQNLNALNSLPTFTALWLTLLDYMDKYLVADLHGELMREAIPESLKNMLLVMHTAKCLEEPLYSITWDRINSFLPHLKDEIFPPPQSQSASDETASMPSLEQAPTTNASPELQATTTITDSANATISQSSHEPLGSNQQHSTTQSGIDYQQHQQHQQQQYHAAGAVNLDFAQTMPSQFTQHQHSFGQNLQDMQYSMPAHVMYQLQQHSHQHQQQPITGDTRGAMKIVSNELGLLPSQASSNVPINAQHTQISESSFSPVHHQQHQHHHAANHADHYAHGTTAEGHMPMISNNYPQNIATSQCQPVVSHQYHHQQHHQQPIGYVQQQQLQAPLTGQQAELVQQPHQQIPLLRSSLHLPEQMYQQLQQQKQYSTSTLTSNTSGYPWPSPGDTKYF